MRFRFLLFAVLFLPLSACTKTPEAKPPETARPPKLAVLVVFDQMRGDYLQRWQDLYTTDGFRRLEQEGTWFTNCHYPYAMTATGPGHASLLTGSSPDKHGIVANTWYDRKEAATVNCSTSPRYERVPPLPPAPPKPPPAAKNEAPEEKILKGFGSPERMLVPSLADSLKQVTQGKGKVFGLSLKDRSAILPAGHKPDGAYWFDRGQFVTSTYYRDRVHPWVAKFNESKRCDKWFGQKWERLRNDIDYTTFGGPAVIPGAGKGFNQGRSFPHPFGLGKQIDKEYYDALAGSPFGNQLLLDLARQAIVEEKLGQRDVPDLLSISFSSNDLIGHVWGPDSQEVLDVTLRSDLIIRDLLKFLDEHVGNDRYVLVLSADHGICPIPEATQAQGREAKRVPTLSMFSAAETHLREKLGEPGDTKSRWIEAANEGGIYLNQRMIEARKLDVDVVASTLADWLGQQESIHWAYTRKQLMLPDSADDSDIVRRVRKSFHPERSGDVIFVSKPYYLVGSFKSGATHGTPHSYDTHVPLLAFGPGIAKRTRDDLVTPQAAASILAKALDIPPPASAEAKLPDGLFR
ncbi:MAG TPA: alkaline phosphatase family protein [Gemmataceae bacterium]|nr:alkaline phosphatase family protein [Gemmataceae bacterium]